jgi:hypothetical protein
MTINQSIVSLLRAAGFSEIMGKCSEESGDIKGPSRDPFHAARDVSIGQEQASCFKLWQGQGRAPRDVTKDERSPK